MLKSLYVKDYVLIDEIKITFGPGLNIITGETGAGKSILVGALGAILGESLSKDSIRQNAQKAIFEAHFDIQPDLLKNVLHENDLDDYDTHLIIRRELNATGRSRAFINDSPVSLPILTEIGDLLVDLHGQHEHQLLLKSSRHIDYLDAFAALSPSLQKIKLSYNTLKQLQHQITDMVNRQEQAKQARDLLRFQRNEISAVAPEEGEDVALQQDEKVLRNAELLFEKTAALYEQLYESDGSVASNLRAAEKALGDLAQIDEKFDAARQECENARIIVDDLSDMLQNYSSAITFDADNLEGIRQRLALLNGLKKKYGGSLESVLLHQHKVEEELSLLENLQDAIADLSHQFESEQLKLADLCQSASSQRAEFGAKLAQDVTSELARLGMNKAEFQVACDVKETDRGTSVPLNGKTLAVTAKGIDHVEFLIRSNPGEPFKPLVNVASGGEISRVMLALKSLLAESDNVPVLIFDEIDAGISGRIAQAVGVSLRKLANSHQVICITHLPQIASMAQHHYLVEKNVQADRTQTRIRGLDDRERLEQIAQLFGGETVTDAHLKSAADLIAEAEKLVK
jgi:DNA repair protein RecN (Recombination protein N)